MVGRYHKGRRGKHGRKRQAFVVHRWPFAPTAVLDKYRYHSGIESSHRCWEQARARTASPRVALRGVLVGVVVLYNLWVGFK